MQALQALVKPSSVVISKILNSIRERRVIHDSYSSVTRRKPCQPCQRYTSSSPASKGAEYAASMLHDHVPTTRMYAVVDDIAKRREPLPALSAVYFIQPSEASLNALIADWSGAKAPYKTAHVFLSTRFLPGILPAFKANCPPLLQSSLRSLKEVCLSPEHCGCCGGGLRIATSADSGFPHLRW